MSKRARPIFGHIFVIVRDTPPKPLHDRYLLSAYFTQEDADQEASRLNALPFPHVPPEERDVYHVWRVKVRQPLPAAVDLRQPRSQSQDS